MSRFGISMVALWVVAVGLSVSATRAEACTCKATPAAAVALSRADSVFSGTVEGVTKSEGDLVINFQVSSSWKGASASRMALRTPEHPVACGIEFEVGVEYLVYARGQGAALNANRCSRTGRLSEKASDLLSLGAARAPGGN